jgi:hypothetical protein
MKKQARLPVGLLALVMLVSLVLSGCAAMPAASASVQAAPQANIDDVSAAAPLSVPAAENPDAGNTGSEGIKVHGHWVIDVSNPDGTLASHNEFENGLTYAGKDLFVWLLSRGGSCGGWTINLDDSQDDPPFVDDSDGTGAGVIAESFFPSEYINDRTSCNLLLDEDRNLDSDSTLTIYGSITASQNGHVDQVQTSVSTSDGAPSEIYNQIAFTFTSKDIDRISISEGQVISVRVVFSFS